MLLLHLSDWHLGRPIGRRERADDHEAALNEQIRIAREHRPDLIVHSGDLFDTFRPSQEVLHQAAWAAREFASIAPTYFVSGNHDSAKLFHFFDEFVGDGDRLRFVTRARVSPSRELATGEDLRMGFLPFFHPHKRLNDMADTELRDAFFDVSEEMVSYRETLGAFQREIGRRMNEGYNPDKTVRIFVAHLGLDGARITRNSGEREMHLGEMYMSDPAYVPFADYGAFGHMHLPQPLPGSTPGRYAGSPLQLDFGEEGEDKSVVLADLAPGRPTRTEILPLTAARRLRRARLELHEVQDDARRLAENGRPVILAVTVHTEKHQRDLSELVREAYAACAGTEVISVVEDCDELRGEALSAATVGGTNESLSDLFASYVEDQEQLGAPATAILDAFTNLSSDLGLDIVDSVFQGPNRARPQDAS